MVGIVLVSHSHELAQAAKALAGQQVQGRAALAAVGGTGDPDFPFGTDALAILEAIQSVYDDDGVLVLMDLGSAILSAETALEFMDPEQAARVRLSAGPFIEGAMAAAVQASIGADLAAVEREAAEAMAPKREALGGERGLEMGDERLEIGEGSMIGGQVTARVRLVNPAGLHFGPAVQFVQLAATFPAEIGVRNLSTGAGPADAKRFNQVLALGAEQGHVIELAAFGPEAEAALAALVALVEAGFGEAEAPPMAAPVAAESPTGSGRAVLRGLAGSPGLAVGRAVWLAEAGGAGAGQYPATAADPAVEWARFTAASQQARDDLAALAGRMGRELGEAQARIFQAHALALADPDLEAAIRAAIFERGASAEAAVFAATEAAARGYEAMTGPRFQERAADMADVGARVLRLLAGAGETRLDLPDEAILLALYLTPSQTANLDRSKVAGFGIALGGPTAHTAILARSLGIPAVVGLGEENLRQIKDGDRLAIDGAAGVLFLEPDEATQVSYRTQQAEEAARRQVAQRLAQAEGRTKDGRRVEVVANLAVAAEAQAAIAAGAEGVGLLRTEFLFQDRLAPPSEDEQTEVYAQVARAMSPRPVIIRTLDIGGDKPAPYLNLPAEANPFLGWRAIRISLALPDFFKVQLRAILRAAAAGDVRVMFPMISTPAEVLAAQALLAEATAELAAAGVEHRAAIPTGIMIEVPSAVTLADQLAPLVDFFSIGTNDLTQYTFAVDRGNARVAALADPLHPALLRQIAGVIDAAHSRGKWVGLCGELAGQPQAIPILLGLGLDEFSMAAPAIASAKTLLAKLTLPEAQSLARRVLDLPDGAAVRAAVDAFLKGYADERR